MREVDKFDALAHRWWDYNGELKTLHDINPARMAFIQQHISLEGLRVLDLGCGGGILSEALAKAGAEVTAIDKAPQAIEIARAHAQQAKLKIDYQCIAADELAEDKAAYFDVITCLEMLEHVDNPAEIINDCARLAKPGAHLFFSTINRNATAYALAILAAEYILNIIPKQTHDYNCFIKPSELARYMRRSSLKLKQLVGLDYNPFNRQTTLTEDVSINYIAFCQK